MRCTRQPRPRTPRCSWSAPRGEGSWGACCPALPPSDSCTAPPARSRSCRGAGRRDGRAETIGAAFVGHTRRAARRCATPTSWLDTPGRSCACSPSCGWTLTMYAETEAKTAGRRAKYLEDVLGEHERAAVQVARRAVAALDGDVDVEVEGFAGEPAEILVRRSRSTSTCSSAARVDTGRCGPCCSEACPGASWPRRAAP